MWGRHWCFTVRFLAVVVTLPGVWAVGFGDKRSGVADEDVLNPNSSSARDAG